MSCAPLTQQYGNGWLGLVAASVIVRALLAKSPLVACNLHVELSVVC